MKTDYLLHREVGHVLAALMPQNRLIARVCLHTGLRVGDVVSLRTQDIGLQMMVTEAKTKKRRRVGLTASLLAAIRAQAGPEWAFPGKRPGTHKTRQAVWAERWQKMPRAVRRALAALLPGCGLLRRGAQPPQGLRRRTPGALRRHPARPARTQPQLDRNHPYLCHGRQASRRQAQAGQAPQTASLTSHHRRGKLGGVLREEGISPTQQNKNFVELEGGFEYK